MPCRILTSDVIAIDALTADYASVLAKSAGGTVAVFANNAPAFYAITPKRLAYLLELETRHTTPGDDLTLDAQFYHEFDATSVAAPVGKFAMYPGWEPDADFQRMATLWGINLSSPVTAEELASFIAYWQAEGKVFHHIQWQQKLARNIQLSRAGSNGIAKRDINILSQPDREIPPGFRGAK